MNMASEFQASKSKKPTAREAKGFPRKAVPVNGGKTEEETCRNHAVVTTSPELAAYRVINETERKSGLGEHIDVPTLLETLRGLPLPNETERPS